MRPLTRDEIRAALRKGRGRIVLHLREHGAAALQDELLEACLHSLVYDAQCESTRADWLMSLIDLTGHAAFYRDRVLDALPGATEFWDVAQLLQRQRAPAQMLEEAAWDCAEDTCRLAREALHRIG
jgi:hypothetical protein